jgi:hypothetical protein
VLEENEIAQRLYTYVSERVAGMKVREVRIGVSYTAIMLDTASTGLAAVMRDNMGSHCTVVPKAGALAGMQASELLTYLTNSRNSVEKALGLATANAILSTCAPCDESDTLTLMHLSPKDHVVMIGFFGPLVSRIKQTGAELTIIEINKDLPEAVSFESRGDRLKTSTVAIITATSILNNTLEAILNDLENLRWVCILGPSTPVCRDIFKGTPVTHLGGSVVLDSERVMQIVSEGGGTPLLRPYLRFVNVLLYEDDE